MRPFLEDTISQRARKGSRGTDKCRYCAMVGGKRSGVIKVMTRVDQLHLHHMRILPEYQTKGIGAEPVRRIIERSEQSRKPITLFMVKNTPAKRRYEKFGFVVTNDGWRWR